jgi:uncharacterized protein (TIGR03663 family)
VNRVVPDVAPVAPPPDPDSPGAGTGVQPRGRGAARFAALLLVAFAVSRFAALSERPLHHDEGVNAWKTEQLIERGYFQYDPTNYHGPTLFLLQLAPTAVSWALAGGGPLTAGLTELSLRSGVALAGCLLLLGVWLARPAIGDLGALAALLLLGTSPGLLYYSRDFIHETHHLLFTLAVWLALQRFVSGGGRVPLLVAAAALALGFCTKETFPISVLGIGLGGLVAGLVGRRESPGVPASFRRERLELGRRLRPQLWDAALLAGAIWFLLFSSFLRHMRGPLDSLKAFVPWASTASGSGHDKVWHWYLSALIWPWEPALLVAGALGLLLAVWLRERVGLLLATWGLVVLGIYSAIPYKTPWLVLNALLPLGLLGGWGVGRVVSPLSRSPGAFARTLAASLSLVTLAGVGWQAGRARQLVYREPDEPRHAYVYVQTRRDLRRLLNRIAAEADPEHPGDLEIDVVSADYWPLPFYLKPYRPRFWGELGERELDAPVVIGSVQQRAEVSQRLGPEWSRLTYDLRPGVKLDLFTRADGS